MSAGYVSGFGGRVAVSARNDYEIVNGQINILGVLPCGRWSIRESIEVADITVCTDADVGIKDIVPQWKDYEITFDCFYNPQLIVLAQPANSIRSVPDLESEIYLRAGSYLTAELFVDRSPIGLGRGPASWYFPLVLITSLSMEQGVRDVAKFSVTAKPCGRRQPLRGVSPGSHSGILGPSHLIASDLPPL